MRIHHLLIGALALTPAVSAQDIAAYITPNPAPVGAPITIAVNDTTGAGFTYNGSAWWKIRAGHPTGPVAGPPIGISLPFIGTTPPYGAPTGGPVVWNQKDTNGVQVKPGTYYFEVSLNGEFFPITIYDPATNTRPILAAPNQPKVGSQLTMKLSAPKQPGYIFFTYWSRSSNNPVQLPGLDIQMDTPYDNNYVVPTFGVIDGTGTPVTPPTLNIPNIPAAKYQGFTVQCLFYSPGKKFVLSNGVPLSIL